MKLVFGSVRGVSSNRLIVQFAIWSMAVSCCLCDGLTTAAETQSPEWIWSADHEKDQVPHATCYFRKTIFLPTPAQGRVEVAADDAYDVFVNGQRVGSGDSWQQLQPHDISKQLRSGRNTFAVKVTNRSGPSAGLAARIVVVDSDSGSRQFTTDSTWRSNLNPLPLWHMPQYSDRRWSAAQNLGPFGAVEPWIVKPVREGEQTLTAHADDDNESRSSARPASSGATVTSGPNRTKREVGPGAGGSQGSPTFRLPKGFQIQHVVGGAETGSLIAMTFNEFGQIIASRENGPLLLVYDTNDNGTPDSVRVYCDKVKSCQGILALSGIVYAVGDGPSGAALYRLEDKDRDGQLEDVQAFVKFQGELGEHGPHGLVLGPDGMIYLTIGNHATGSMTFSPTSPMRHLYGGDLVGPRIEDPTGHAAGITVPGGAIVRTDTRGKSVELVAGGLRNAYDLAFNSNGELLTHDSDMETDEGTPWHRPTRVHHIIPGGEYGWRSGWAKWPDYYVDALPPLLDTGRGSPTGLVVYDHETFPARYHQAVLTCDWSQGRIEAIRLKRSGAGFKAQRELLLEGRPLNVTDIDVGPDGWVYFTTGGRGTRGDVYRIVWKSAVPKNGDEPTYAGVESAVRQPQLQSAWSRQAVATRKLEFGAAWKDDLVAIARDATRAAEHRTRALSLMHLLGPPPTSRLLVELSDDSEPSVRAKSAQLMGLVSSPTTKRRLMDLLGDTDAVVRRSACEALARSDQPVALDPLIPLLSSADRFEAWAARRLLERNVSDDWHKAVLETEDRRVFIQGATAMMISAPNRQRARQIVGRVLTICRGFVTDNDFVDIMRVTQLALVRGQLTAKDVPQLASTLADEYPAGNSLINRELVRLLVCLQTPSVTERFVQQLDSPDGDVEKVHLAMHLRFLKSGWKPQQQLDLLRFFDRGISQTGAGNRSAFLERAARDFANTLDVPQRRLVVQSGHEIPRAALAALYGLPNKMDAGWIRDLVELDGRIARAPGLPYHRLRVGIVAMLGQQATPSATDYLRELFDRDPERRQEVAMCLAQQPDRRDWDYLVRSIPILEGVAAKEVLASLSKVEFLPSDPELYRQVILCGLRLKDQDATDAIALLEHWSGEKASDETEPSGVALAAWQRWYHTKYPTQPRAELPEESGQNRWSFDDLRTFLEGKEGSSGSVARGTLVYRKAECAKCHRHGDEGDSVGPDLTSLAQRFQKKEVLESIVYPSHVISDQYKSQSVVTDDGRSITGLVVAGAADKVEILKADGEKVAVAKDEIDELIPSSLSVMPEGMLNPLTLGEIADLFAFLMAPQDVALARGPDVDTKR